MRETIDDGDVSDGVVQDLVVVWQVLTLLNFPRPKP